MTLWLWLWLLPAAIGLSVPTWGACLSVLAAYLVLFSLNMAITSIGTADAAQDLALAINDALMILVVTIAAQGLRHAFMSDDR